MQRWERLWSFCPCHERRFFGVCVFVDPAGTNEESISWDEWIMRGKRQIPLRCVICMMPYCAIWIYMI